MRPYAVTKDGFGDLSIKQLKLWFQHFNLTVPKGMTEKSEMVSYFFDQVPYDKIMD